MRNRKKRCGKGPVRHSTAWRVIVLLLIITFIIPQVGCSSNDENYQGISKTGFYLDTICTITIYGVDPESRLGKELAQAGEEQQKKKILQLITDAFLECDRCEKILSKTVDTSEIAQINRAGGKTVTVGDMTAEVIRKGLEFGDLSGGAFDITIGKATDLWNFHDVDEKHESEDPLPEKAALEEAVRHVNYRKVHVDGNQVTLGDPEMEIDLGGIAKGYISDRLAVWLQEQGVVSAVIDLGGNIVAMGGKSKQLLQLPEEDFTIGIRNPQDSTGQLLAAFTCRDKAVVTSGTYERYVEKDGKKYHHILDPKTGMPADTDVESVTIIMNRGHGADADGLSTTCLALGVKKGMELIESTDDAEAVFVDRNETVSATSGAPDLTWN